MLDSFSRIQIESPVDKIVGQIKELVHSGELNAGQKLPSERALAEQLDVGRSYVRDAIKKLEFFGVLRTSPQSGTYVVGVGVTALQGLIGDVLAFEGHEFNSLVETRTLIECEAAALAATRRTDADIKDLQYAFDQHKAMIEIGDPAVEADLLFHVKIAEASKNTVLQSLLMIITPDIIKRYRELKICANDDLQKTLHEHQQILDCIISKDALGANSAMATHLQDVLLFSKNSMT
ncbi:MAG: FadR/GntR family transcriptional regulator [Saprospiraceae bacterium]